MASTCVVLVADHTAVRAGLKNLLNGSPDIEVIGEASDVAEALRRVEELIPDVLVLDIDMSPLGSITVTHYLLETQSPVHVLALSTYEDKQFILGYLAEGITGYLVKDDVPKTIVDGVRSVSCGEAWLSPRAATKVTPEK